MSDDTVAMALENEALKKRIAELERELQKRETLVNQWLAEEIDWKETGKQLLREVKTLKRELAEALRHTNRCDKHRDRKVDEWECLVCAIERRDDLDGEAEARSDY